MHEGPASGYTNGMKTAISLPDEMFEQADRLADRLELSRSELYRRALEEYLARHEPDRVTEQLDRVADALATRSDAFVRTAVRTTLEKAEW